MQCGGLGASLTSVAHLHLLQRSASLQQLGGCELQLLLALLHLAHSCLGAFPGSLLDRLPLQNPPLQPAASLRTRAAQLAKDRVLAVVGAVSRGKLASRLKCRQPTLSASSSSWSPPDEALEGRDIQVWSSASSPLTGDRTAEACTVQSVKVKGQLGSTLRPASLPVGAHLVLVRRSAAWPSPTRLCL